MSGWPRRRASACVRGTSVARAARMDFNRFAASLFAVLSIMAVTSAASAQPAASSAPPPPPLWDVQVGASFVGTSGNSDTATTGADFTTNRRGKVWQIEGAASAVRTATDDVTTAERYLALGRAQRALTPMIGVTSGEKLEHDPFAGLDLRSILDLGLSWTLIHRPSWTLDGLTSIAWLHESHTTEAGIDDPIGVLQLRSKIPFGAGAETTQRFTYYPNFDTASAYRSEAEITAQATMTGHLALKFGYLVRYSNAPVTGFKKTDVTTTASIVLRWKAAAAAPAP